MPNNYDLVIVGAGIIGGMSAWQAAIRNPQWRILWLDRGLIGLGATAYSAGLITPLGRSARIRELALRSKYLRDSLMDLSGTRPLEYLNGWMLTDKDQADSVRSWFISASPHEALSQLPVTTRATLPTDLSFSKNEEWIGPFEVEKAASSALLASIVCIFRQAPNGVLWEGVDVRSWSSENDGVTVHLSSNLSVRAKRLILATGPWGSPDEIPELRIKKVAAYHIERDPLPSAPVVLFARHDAFLLPLHREKRWLFSFASPEWDVSPEGERLEFSQQDDQIAKDILTTYVPSFAGSCRGGRIFCDAYTFDRVPLVKALCTYPPVFYVGGGSGSGVRLGAALAEEAITILEEI